MIYDRYQCPILIAEHGISRIETPDENGFVYVDRDNQGQGTQKRVPKASYAWYKKVISSWGQDLD